MAATLRAVDVLLIGGGVASVRCARTLRRRGFAGSILLVAEEPHAPYNRPPLTKELLRGEAPIELAAAEPDAWYARQRVELMTGSPVVALSPAERIAHLQDGTRIRFERCLLATGAEPLRPPIPGAEHALVLRTLDDLAAIRASLAMHSRAARTVTIGGGFIGVEAAASLAALGGEVIVLERGGALWAGSLGEEISAWALASLQAVGVTVRLATSATSLDAEGAWVAGEHLAADLVLAGVGIVPRIDLASGQISAVDGIAVDARRETAAAGIFAAGDAAAAPHPLADGRRIRVEHWHAAREGGEAAALGILGEDPSLPPAPWVYSEFAGQLLDVVGWAPDWDGVLMLGDPGARETDGKAHFLVAYLRSGAVAQLAIVNGAMPVEMARAAVADRPSPSQVQDLFRAPRSTPRDVNSAGDG